MIDLIKNRRMDYKWPQIMERRPIDNIVLIHESGRVRERLGIYIPRESWDDDATNIPIREND